MKIMRNNKLCALLCLLCVVWTFTFVMRRQALGDSSFIFQPTPEYQHAMELLGDSLYGEAEIKLRSIIANNPGTALAAQCQLDIAGMIYLGANHDPVKAAQELQNVIVSYQGTGAEYTAREALADVTISSPIVRAQEYDRLIKQLGGLSFFEIARLKSLRADDDDPEDMDDDNLAKFNAHVARQWDPRMLSGIARGVLPGLYIDALDLLKKANKVSNDDEYRILKFVREKFLWSQGSQLALSALKSLASFNKHAPFPQTIVQDQAPPKILRAFPRNGSMRNDSTPMIGFLLTDGPISESQVDVTTMKVFLDGVDITNKVLAHTFIKRHMNMNGRGAFEKILVMYHPEAPLSAAVHAVEVQVKDQKGNPSVYGWQFTIKPRR